MKPGTAPITCRCFRECLEFTRNLFAENRRIISSGGSEGGAGGSGSVPSRRTLCSSLGAGVSGPCESCALALDAAAAPAKMANTNNARARVILRSRRFSAGPKDLNVNFLATRQLRATGLAADRGWPGSNTPLTI